MSLKDKILLGTSLRATFFSNFLQEEIKLRPLTAFEMDDVIIKALHGIVTKKIVDLIINMHLQLLDQQEEVDLTPEEYAEFKKYRTEIDYLVCWYAMRDFCDITLDELKASYVEVHDMARYISSLSIAKPHEITEFVKSDEGLILATIHYRMHVPLAGEAWKLTGPQKTFLTEAYLEYLSKEKSDAETGDVFSNEQLKEDPKLFIKRFKDATSRKAGRGT